ncbi:hypothetical protein EIB18_01115 [Caulobacter vibrioides]|nr:hypothetical protein EIB18_01115 [Caulobacter vibrioides]
MTTGTKTVVLVCVAQALNSRATPIKAGAVLERDIGAWDMEAGDGLLGGQGLWIKSVWRSFDPPQDCDCESSADRGFVRA